MTTTTISSKGQITIPKRIRDRHHLETGDKIEFLEDDQGMVTIWPITQDVTQLKGIIKKPDKKVTLEDMQQTIVEEGGKI